MNYPNSYKSLVLLILTIIIFNIQGCGETSDNSENDTKNIITIGGRGTENGYFFLPRTVAYSKAENAFIVTDKSGRIQKFTEDGKFINVWHVPFNQSLEIEKRGYPAGIEISPDNKLYVCDSHQAQILVYDTDGKLLRKFGCFGTDLGQYSLSGRMTFISKDEYFVSEYKSDAERITYYKNNDPVRTVGKSGRGQGEFMRSIGICLDSEKNLYVADANNHRVQVFDKDGKFKYTFGTKGDADGQLMYPYGIEYDPEIDVIIVTEFGNSRLSFFRRDGRFIGKFGKQGYMRGEFLGIWDIAIGNKYYYVPDYNNNRVTLIKKEYLRSFMNLKIIN